MYKIVLTNIFNRSKIDLSVSVVPRTGETFRLEKENLFYLVRGITQVFEVKNIEAYYLIYVEPINESYWINNI